jgi:TonB family protein
MRRRIRYLALAGFLAFIAISAVLHFTMGSAIATYFPTWRYATPPDQAISIISLSRNARERHEPPTPEPTSPPKIVQRTATRIVPLKFREMSRSDASQIGSIRTPARRKSNLFIVGPRRPKPGTEEGPAASNAVEPTPLPGAAAARLDTGGRSEELIASVWGDDNPPRVLHAEQVSIASPPPKPVRIAVEVGPDGNVISARVIQSSGDQNLDDLALDAARKTVFAPATLNGLPVHGSIVLEYPATTGST